MKLAFLGVEDAAVLSECFKHLSYVGSVVVHVVVIYEDIIQICGTEEVQVFAEAVVD